MLFRSPERLQAPEPVQTAKPIANRDIFDANSQQRVSANIYDRDHLKPGMSFEGPAIVVERETATLVTASFRVTVQRDGCLLASAIDS